MSVLQYQEDGVFDEAFKHLLNPIESIAIKDECEVLQYDLTKVLDSYLNHLRKSPNDSSSVFVEAAIIIQNISLIYQKRVDVTINAMMKLIGKFRSYRLYENIDPDYYTEKRVGNKKNKINKKIKCYSSFGPIEGQIVGTLKIFDCKQINLGKKPRVTKIILNTNIKVDNKYSKILPYICNKNGENIGKKYDFKINFPLDYDLAVNEEFHFPTKEDSKSKNLINYRNNTNAKLTLPMNLLNVDGILPSASNSVIFYQNVTDDICVVNEMLPNPIDMLSANQITPNNDNNGPRAKVLNAKSDFNTDKRFGETNDSPKKGRKLLLSTCINTKLHSLVHDEEVEKIIKNDEPIEHFQTYQRNSMEHFQTFQSNSIENLQTYQRNSIEMQDYEKNQMRTMNDQLEMQKRVQEWHDKLRPILENEEKMIEFDVHKYGTHILSCFESIGEQKLFKNLVAGINKEEVARYYLSLLMMVNTNNLEISNHTDGNELLIKLLKKERHHEELQFNIENLVNKK
ncbi:uncharacterized protein LOC112598686, partial [Melanaphis sacchari]|uniref:uncharacterized protein LOC112598686 n=1 Tax=Melanaphis sacchari TaxID=742174 RepID=UPI000DC1310F